MSEKFESSESKEENLSEYQREILESVGVESIAELNDILEAIEENLKSVEGEVPNIGNFQSKRNILQKY